MLRSKLLTVRLKLSFIGSRSSSEFEALAMTRVLNVAEKNDASKNISEIMSNGQYNRREGVSRFNKVYEFDYQLWNSRCRMVMTSVSGHVLNTEFVGCYRKWNQCSPVALFDAPIAIKCPPESLDVMKNLQKEAPKCSKLIIWTDGDREGENIGFEIIQICKEINPRLAVYRARFSEITTAAINRACANLQDPDENVNNAVEVRRELDLRIGASFTRFQTLRLQRRFPAVLAEQLISYGSCQFPTMGFVIDRYKQAQNFKPESFWKIVVTDLRDDVMVTFNWNRQRLFNHLAVLALYKPCVQNPVATVMDMQTKPKSKWRPLPLDTIELEKTASRKLRLTAKVTMTIAEKLYTQGLISYPRTETNIFPKEMDLNGLVQLQTLSPQWGEFAGRVVQDGATPRQGTKTDNAHPPIHPLKYTNGLGGDDKRVYEFVVRHFLACCSKDAQGMETTVEIQITIERFKAKGLMILERNYLDVYPYDKWSDKEMGVYNPGEIFEPKSIKMEEGVTTAPALLTEADLIALMEKHGIGTDATHADHIERIKTRLYVGLNADSRFVPGELGIGLSDGYDAMGLELSKPNLRAGLESDLKLICDGQKDHRVVLAEQIKLYKDIFIKAGQQADKIDSELQKYFGAGEAIVDQPIVEQKRVMKCPKCKRSDIVVNPKANGAGFMLGCMGFPDCKSSTWFPDFVKDVKVTEQNCPRCPPGTFKLSFKIDRGGEPESYTACFACEDGYYNMLDMRRLPTGPDVSLRQAVIQPGVPNQRQVANRAPRQPANQIRTPRQTPDGPPAKKKKTTNKLDEVKCNCDHPAMKLTVRKEGANCGREFYKCGEQPQRCNFFKWADEIAMAAPQPATNGVDPNTILCVCGGPAKLLTVNKDGPNKGRPFYSCPKPREQACRFFKWADE